MGAGDANLTRFRERDRRSALTVTSSDSPGPSPHQPQLPPSLHSTPPTPVHDPHHKYISSDCRSLHLGPVRHISVHTLARPHSPISTPAARQSPPTPQPCLQPQASPGRSTRRTLPTTRSRRRRSHLSLMSKLGRCYFPGIDADAMAETSRC